MTTISLTADTFAEHIQKDGILFIDFWASWCGPCRAFAPVFEAAAQENPDIVWAKVDTQAEQELAGALEIRSIPTLMIFRDGLLLFSQPGALPAAALADLVEQVRSLDMAEIKRQLGEAKTAETASSDSP
ncbi:MAG TPA: thioredoxin [Polyangiaceae bacterium]|nr:thioredoxin [Polyangiaceae bacterium]